MDFRTESDLTGVPDLHIISHESQIDPDPGPELFPPKKDTKTDPDPGSFHGSKKIRIQIPDPDPTSKDPDPGSRSGSHLNKTDPYNFSVLVYMNFSAIMQITTLS